MQVQPVQHSNSYVPVQPVAPVKSKSQDAPPPPKVKAATPPHVGAKVDVHA